MGGMGEMGGMGMMGGMGVMGFREIVTMILHNSFHRQYD